jgi:hypothetical protein
VRRAPAGSRAALRARRGAGFAGAWLVCAAALATHPALDWLNNYGLRPWLPFDATWTYGDMAFIVDPWLWLLFGGAAALAGERTRRGSLLLLAVGVGASLLVLLNGRTPEWMVVWPALALAIAVARVSRRRRARIRGACSRRSRSRRPRTWACSRSSRAARSSAAAPSSRARSDRKSRSSASAPTRTRAIPGTGPCSR